MEAKQLAPDIRRELSTLDRATMVNLPAVSYDIPARCAMSALTNAGIAYTQPTSTMAMGQSVCPRLFEPGHTDCPIAMVLVGWV
ncbi:hypothetical protein MAHJHV47_46290 [Mycobacterium avium subsp. hominissuis]